MIKKYLIILFSVFVGIIVFYLISHLIKKYSSNKKINFAYFISALIGVLTFFLMIILMEQNAGKPFTNYTPPKIENGFIVKGNFK